MLSDRLLDGSLVAVPGLRLVDQLREVLLVCLVDAVGTPVVEIKTGLRRGLLQLSHQFRWCLKLLESLQGCFFELGEGGQSI